MNQRACFYFHNRDEALGYCATHPADFLEFSNKFRSCIYVADEQFESTEKFVAALHYTSVLRVHEVLTQYLTYTPPPEPAIITAPLIENRTLPFWIHDIDVWVALPEAARKKIINYGPHIFYYPNLDFVKSLR